jgi:SAM-dependent methyltransferase
MRTRFDTRGFRQSSVVMSELIAPAAFGKGKPLSFAERAGVWLSGRRLRRSVGSFHGKRVGDFGCGYNASFVRSILGEVQSAVLLDISLAQDLKIHQKVCPIEGRLPDAMSSVTSASLDVVLCVSLLEHLERPLDMLVELRRVTAPGGICLINVPNWLGKRFLEFSAFRLGTSEAEYIDDHKSYYDPRELWPLLVRAGFRPRNIRCYRHKLFLNTFAQCRIEK